MIICPRCARPLPDWLLRDSHTSSICPQCNSKVEVHCFPALYQAEEKLDGGQMVLGEGDACCYEHAEKKASAICSNCGRFLCALCEVQLGSKVLCPDCVSNPTANAAPDAFDRQRTNYDSIALAVATWPLMLFYFVVFTAPLSLGMSIFAWRKPLSLVRRNKWRLYLAIGISTLEIAGMAALIFTLVNQMRGKPL